MTAEFEALRLSAWGLSVLLAWLLFYRWQDYRTCRLLAPDERAIQPLTLRLTVLAGSGLSALTLLAFTVPLFRDQIHWLSASEPVTSTLALLVLLGLLVLLIDRVAYHPEAKWRWAAGWMLFVHAMIWGAKWLA